MSSSYKKRKCEPKVCRFCGEMFVPTHGNQKLCDDCRRRLSGRYTLEWTITYEGPTNVDEYEKRLEKQNRERYHDTIIAIGYAERQKADSLAKAGRVKTEL